MSARRLSALVAPMLGCFDPTAPITRRRPCEPDPR